VVAAAHPRRLALFLPYLGAYVFQSDGQDNRFSLKSDAGQDQSIGMGPGFRLGALLGLRPLEAFSINGELTIDVLNLRNVPSDVDLTAFAVELSLSPMLHFGQGALELVVGPKLGAWASLLESKGKGATGGGDQTSKASASGYALGGNAGAFAHLSEQASVGLLVSYVVRSIGRICETPPDGSESCGDPLRSDSDKVLGITAAMLF
jgi:hypothetical protein